MTQHPVISCYRSNEVKWGKSMVRILKTLIGSTVDNLVKELVGPLHCRHLFSDSSPDLNLPCVRESVFEI